MSNMTDNIFSAHAMGKLVGMTIGTLTTVNDKRANTVVSVIAISGAAYFAKRLLKKEVENAEKGIPNTNKDFLGGLVSSLVATTVAGVVINNVVGETPEAAIVKES